MPWLQDPNKRNIDELNKLLRDARRYLRNYKKEYVKFQIDQPKTNSEI